jgi:glutathione S-transferase
MLLLNIQSGFAVTGVNVQSGEREQTILLEKRLPPLERTSPTETSTLPVIVGRSSSHFTRVARIFACECGVDIALQVVPDLTSTDLSSYGGNPALRVPTLKTSRGTWFGSLNACRELHRLAAHPPKVIWPEQLAPMAANAQELVTQAMATEVLLIMAKLDGDDEAARRKPRASLLGMLDWLERHFETALATLPVDRGFSMLEIALYCLITHLGFRDVVPTAPYPRLRRFADSFGERSSARATEFIFDPPPVG